jgi:zinc/manganese transport system substrate-binding protein
MKKQRYTTTSSRTSFFSSIGRKKLDPGSSWLFRKINCLKSVYIVSILFLLIGISPTSHAAPKPLHVIASFSILGDMIKQVGGDTVDVIVLAGPNTDLHAYQASPNDIKALAAADIIAINGLGLDRWMHGLIEASGTRAKLLVASAGIKPITGGEGNKAVPDPHAWQDLTNGRIYARNIAAALITAAPEQGKYIKERAIRYDAELKKMDKAIRDELAGIPPNKRKIITTHDAFRYFGEAYGITFIAPLGMNEDAEPTAIDIAKLIEQIKHEDIKEVFIENIIDPRLMQQIAKDSGAKLGGELYSDSLSPPNGPAPTYLDLFRNNVPKMKEAIE